MALHLPIGLLKNVNVVTTSQLANDLATAPSGSVGSINQSTLGVSNRNRNSHWYSSLGHDTSPSHHTEDWMGVQFCDKLQSNNTIIEHAVYSYFWSKHAVLGTHTSPSHHTGLDGRGVQFCDKLQSNNTIIEHAVYSYVWFQARCPGYTHQPISPHWGLDGGTVLW